MIGLILFLISTGIFMRGFLYYLASKLSMNSKFKNLSISKSEDALEYTEENVIGAKAYMTIGCIVSLFTIILLITFYDLVTMYWFMFIISILFIDLLTNVLVNVKLKIDKYDKEQKKGE